MRRESDLSKLISMAKDHENTCSRLLSNTRRFDHQLQVLRAEHEALRSEAWAMRRCLDRAGVLPAEELEKEMQRVQERKTASFSPVQAVDDRGQQAEARSSSQGRDRGANSEASRTRTPLRPRPAASAPAAASTPAPRGRPVESPMQPAVQEPRPKEQQRADLLVPPGSARGRSRSGSGSASSRTRSSTDSGSPCPVYRRSTASDALSKTGSLPRRSGDEDFGEVGTQDLYEIAKPLLERGSHTAAQQKALRRLTRLLQPGTMSSSGSWSGPGSPLLSAVRAGRVDFVRLLLQAGAAVNHQGDKGVTPLHLAVFEGDVDLCRVLLAGKADVDLCDCHGQTPLFFSPTCRICKLLIEQYADMNALNYKGQSALHLAGRAGLHDVLGWLTQRASKSLVELRDVYGATAKHYAQHGVSGADGSSPARLSTSRAISSPQSSVSDSPMDGSGMSSPPTGKTSHEDGAPHPRRSERWRSGSGSHSGQPTEEIRRLSGYSSHSASSLHGQHVNDREAEARAGSPLRMQQLRSGSQSARSLRPNSSQGKLASGPASSARSLGKVGGSLSSTAPDRVTPTRSRPSNGPASSQASSSRAKAVNAEGHSTTSHSKAADRPVAPPAEESGRKGHTGASQGSPSHRAREEGKALHSASLSSPMPAPRLEAATYPKARSRSSDLSGVAEVEEEEEEAEDAPTSDAVLGQWPEDALPHLSELVLDPQMKMDPLLEEHEEEDDDDEAPLVDQPQKPPA